MDSGKLRMLLHIVEKGSMMKAADALGYTPSGLSHMMDAVERELGVTVLTRTNRGIELTDAGKALLPKLKRYVALDAQIKEEARKLGQTQTAKIRIGAYTSIANHWLPTAIADFSEAHPEREIELFTLSTSQCYAQLEKGTIDLAFCCRDTARHCAFTPLGNDEIFAVFPPDAPVGESDFPLGSFEGQPFIIPSQGSDEEITHLLEKHHIKPKILASAAEDSVVIQMVSSGIGSSMLSKLVLTGHEKAVARRSLAPRVYRELGIAYRDDGAFPILEEFMQRATRQISNLSAP